MAVVILSDKEIKILKSKTHDGQKVKDTINQLAGDLGGYGIDVVDIKLRPVMQKEFQGAFNLIEKVVEWVK